MSSVHRRSRLRLVRFVARLVPVLAWSAVATAFVLDGWWPVVAATIAAVLTTVVSVLVFRVDRRHRTDVATVRARMAAAYAAEHARYADEHRAFTDHLVALLDAASSRIGLLRHRVDWLESELAAARLTRETAANKPGAELVRLSDSAEWDELWPDLAEVPTVVGLVAWDARAQDDEPLISSDERDEDEQDQRRSA